ncbi:MAG: hypothetical protein GTO02_14760 [Candidatus Dadabacteria bacterium]|nr:hypothetical protein [Candidatus Dadabacteria bacterium]
MSNPTWPVHTFKVKLADPLRNAWSLPSNMQPRGNETEAESVNIPKTFTSWIPSILPGPNIAQKNESGETFTAYGAEATYLKKTYANGSPDDLLTIVS